MTKKVLSREEFKEKLNVLSLGADSAIEDSDLMKRLGAIATYAAMSDFYAIQAARLIEEIILKAQLATTPITTFEPKGDSFFSDNQVRTRKILSEIKKYFLALRNSNIGDTMVDNISIAAQKYTDSTSSFLVLRNMILHNLCSKDKSIFDISSLVKDAGKKYLIMCESHKEFMLLAQPFRFSEKEIKHFGD
jgi:hypothetical protein